MLNPTLRRAAPWGRISNPWIVRASLLIAAALLVAGGWTLWNRSLSATSATTAEVKPQSDAPPAEPVVRLSGEKLQTAAIHAAPVEVRELFDVRRVPGRIGYDTARRLEVKLPVGGVARQVMVQPGQQVKRGDALAVLSSTEVGLARDQVVQAEADLQVAKRESDWAGQINDNLTTLGKLLSTHPDMTSVEQQFQERVLGEHRDKVFSAYSRLLLAERIVKSTEPLVTDGSVSSQLAQQRRSDREVAAAQFQSYLEKSRFDASQQFARAEAGVHHAERLLAVNQQKLNLLLGSVAELSSAPSDDEICELVLRAPVDGVIEERFVTSGMHFVASQVLVTLANTDKVWVSAQVYEREWALLNQANVKELSVDAPAVPGGQAKAKVLYVGVSMSAETRAVPLVAELPNPDGRYKPGMFAWVSIPMGAAHRGLAVPAAAVTRHEQQAFVFVEQSPGTYRKIDVEVGLATPDWIEVTHGLEAGQRVVDEGAFVLKSELLLAGEEP